MRHPLAAAGCVITLALGLTACGDSAPQSQDSASTPPAATSADTSADTSTPSLGATSSSSSTGSTSSPGSSTPDANGTGMNGATSESSSAAAQQVPAGQPARLSMPSIGFDRSVRGLGVNGQGQISPPAGTTQWYNKSVVPGQPGISVIAGHVTYNGPDVFYRLDRLSVGDTVTVTYGNGATKAFKVYAEEAVDKKKLQSDPRVWGGSSKPVLALITCDAASRVIGNHHVDNYVVWAAPA